MIDNTHITIDLLEKNTQIKPTMVFDPANIVDPNSVELSVEPSEIKLVENGEGTTALSLSFKFNGYDDVLSTEVSVTVDLPEENKLLEFSLNIPKSDLEKFNNLCLGFKAYQQFQNNIALVEKYLSKNSINTYSHNYITENIINDIIFLPISQPNDLDSDKNLTIAIYLKTISNNTNDISNINFSAVANYLTDVNFLNTISDKTIVNNFFNNFTFQNCSKLSSLVLPSATSSLNLALFNYTNNLISFTIPSAVSNIEDSTFDNCVSLSSLLVENNNSKFASVNNILIDKTENKIIRCPINIQLNETNNINNILENINKSTIISCFETNSFKDVINLNNISIPESIKKIGNNVFSGCDNLSSISIPNSISSIGDETFADCFNLKMITIGQYICNIGLKNIFPSIKSIEEITILNGVTEISSNFFNECINVSAITIPETISSIGDNAFMDCYNLKSIIIPDSVISVGYGIFDNCSQISNIIIGNGLSSINIVNMFNQCYNLSSISLGKNVSNVEDDTFIDCYNLTIFNVNARNLNYKSVNGLLLSKDGKTLIKGINGNVVIPDGVISVKNNAFYCYTSLMAVTIPSSVESIGYNVFRGCTQLTAIIFNGKTKEQVENMENYPWGIQNLDYISVK